MPPTFVIVGASLAGGTAAATLRQEGFDGDVILIGEELHPFYERPPLSKQYLRGEVPFEKAWVRPGGFYEANAIDTRFGDAATQVDPAERKVDLTSGRSVRHDKLMIATGVRNRRLPILDWTCRMSSISARSMTPMPTAPRSCLAGRGSSLACISQRRMRVEHWQNAMQQGAAAARSMLGRVQPYDPVHWVWSDQYDVNRQYAGFHQGWDEVVMRGNPDSRDFIAFYLSRGCVDAVVALNRGKDVRRAMPLIKARAAVDPRQLADEGMDLRSLLEGPLSGVHP